LLENPEFCSRLLQRAIIRSTVLLLVNTQH